MSNENTQPEPIEMTYARGTDTGRARDHNEDYVEAFISSDANQRRQKGDLFIVADGMGGHQAGEVASKDAVHLIWGDYCADPDLDIPSSLVRAIQQANAFIYQQAQQVVTQTGMGTTVVAAVVRGRELYLANVGDSRAYLMRQGKVSQVTQDHSFVAEQIRAGILTREEARAHPQRNVITRALGSKPEVEVDTYRGELQAGDVLLLCSDGLSEHVQEEDMQHILSRHLPEDAVQQLIALANDRGGNDNISVLIVRAASPVAVAPQKPVAPIARPVAPPRRRSLLPRAVGVGAIVLIGVVILVALLLLVPQFLGSKGPASPTSPLPTPTVAPSTVPTNTPLPTSTPRVIESEPTATRETALSLLEPTDGKTTLPGDVQFRWKWIGDRPLSFAFVLQTAAGELCRSSEEFCSTRLQAGDYEWWVELGDESQVIHQSEHRILYVRLPSPTPTATPPPPPTEAPQPKPQLPTTETPQPKPQLPTMPPPPTMIP